MNIPKIQKPFIFTLTISVGIGLFMFFTMINANQRDEDFNKSEINKEVKTMKITKTDVNTTEKMIIDRGHHQLSGEEIKRKITGKTVWGDYYNGRTYVTYIDKDGSAEGKWADIIVLDQNLFEIPIENISDTQVEMTMFEGKIVYKIDSAGN